MCEDERKRVSRIYSLDCFAFRIFNFALRLKCALHVIPHFLSFALCIIISTSLTVSVFAKRMLLSFQIASLRPPNSLNSRGRDLSRMRGDSHAQLISQLPSNKMRLMPTCFKCLFIFSTSNLPQVGFYSSQPYLRIHILLTFSFP